MDTILLYAVVPIVAGFFLFALLQGLVRLPGQALAKKFAELGDMKGKSKAKIIAAVGEPTSRSINDGGELLQWLVVGYHIAIQFDSTGKFVAVTHEAKT